MKKSNILITTFWLIIFISGTFFGLEFLLATIQKLGTVCLFIPIIYLILTIESEIFFFEKIINTTWWQKSFLNFLGRKNNDKRILDNKIVKRTNKFEYLVLIISTSVIHLSKFGVILFIYNKKALPYGRQCLYAGCIIRVITEYLLIKGLLTIT